MSTTIQVSDTTKQLLDILKKHENTSSYDQLILGLVKDHARISKSMFGAVKGIQWKKKDRMKLHEL